MRDSKRAVWKFVVIGSELEPYNPMGGVRAKRRAFLRAFEKWRDSFEPCRAP